MTKLDFSNCEIVIELINKIDRIMKGHLYKYTQILLFLRFFIKYGVHAVKGVSAAAAVPTVLGVPAVLPCS